MRRPDQGMFCRQPPPLWFEAYCGSTETRAIRCASGDAAGKPTGDCTEALCAEDDRFKARFGS